MSCNPSPVEEPVYKDAKGSVTGAEGYYQAWRQWNQWHVTRIGTIFLTLDEAIEALRQSV